MVLVRVQKFGAGTNYGLEILHQCGKRVKIKCQKVWEANSNFCTRREGAFLYLIFRPLIFIDEIKTVTLFITYTHL